MSKATDPAAVIAEAISAHRSRDVSTFGSSDVTDGFRVASGWERKLFSRAEALNFFFSRTREGFGNTSVPSVEGVFGCFWHFSVVSGKMTR
jgi:hypothetical protein